jgi:hypothetical protein
MDGQDRTGRVKNEWIIRDGMSGQGWKRDVGTVYLQDCVFCEGGNK